MSFSALCTNNPLPELVPSCFGTRIQTVDLSKCLYTSSPDMAVGETCCEDSRVLSAIGAFDCGTTGGGVYCGFGGLSHPRVIMHEQRNGNSVSWRLDI